MDMITPPPPFRGLTLPGGMGRYKSSDVVHHLGDGGRNLKGRGYPFWGEWALCGGSGTRRLKLSTSSVTCKACLIIEQTQRR